MGLYIREWFHDVLDRRYMAYSDVQLRSLLLIERERGGVPDETTRVASRSGQYFRPF